MERTNTASMVLTIDLDSLVPDQADYIRQVFAGSGIVATGPMAQIIAAALEVGRESWEQHDPGDIYPVRLTIPEDLNEWWISDDAHFPAATDPWTLDEHGTLALIAMVLGHRTRRQEVRA